jgi:hypothetical protein
MDSPSDVKIRSSHPGSRFLLSPFFFFHLITNIYSFKFIDSYMPNLRQGIPPTRKPGAAQPGVSPRRAPLPAPRGVSGEGDWERISPETRARVWKKRFGFRSTGTCVCCHQRTIHRDDFACGERRAYPGSGGSDVSNLEPICAVCKEQMGTHDLVSWCRKSERELQVVKPMPVTTKKTVKKPAAKKAAVKKPVKKTTVKKTVVKTAAVKKPVKKAAAKKPAAKKAKR